MTERLTHSCGDCGHEQRHLAGAVMTCGHCGSSNYGPDAAMTCGCENSHCRTGHMGTDGQSFTRCQNEGTIGVMYVGRLCSACSEYMPSEYLTAEGRDDD